MAKKFETAHRTPTLGRPLRVGARAISGNGGVGKWEDAVYFTSPPGGEVGRRPGEGGEQVTMATTTEEAQPAAVPNGACYPPFRMSIEKFEKRIDSGV